MITGTMGELTPQHEEFKWDTFISKTLSENASKDLDAFEISEDTCPLGVQSNSSSTWSKLACFSTIGNAETKCVTYSEVAGSCDAGRFI